MRIALLSDIHGNDIALAAVLTDIATQGPIDEYWILGDLLAIGAEPAAVYHRLQALNANQTVRYVRGNTDRFILSGDRPPPFLDEAYGDQQQTYVYGEVMANFAWTEGALAALNGRDFIASLPLSQRLDLPDGTRMLGVHCAQGDDAGFGFRPDSTDEQLRALYANHEADLIFMG
ncbi:MAG: metallophosphoesterase, partial [Anaerolineales bacterium]|nr:metallophosphoesterase [Anaerolineales bacterium]